MTSLPRMSGSRQRIIAIVALIVIAVVAGVALFRGGQAERLCAQAGEGDDLVASVAMMSAILDSDDADLLTRQLRIYCSADVDRLLGVNVGR